MRKAALAGILTLAAGGAGAETPGGRAVDRMLFKGAAVEVEVIAQPFLPPDQAKLLPMVGQGQPYYGAVAASPDEGLLVEATVAAANHHSTEAAEAAARAECDARRKGRTPCVTVALIRPRDWQPRPVTLSAAATEGFVQSFLRLRGDRAFAVSDSTGAWGAGAGAEAALAQCAAGGAPDCRVIAAD